MLLLISGINEIISLVLLTVVGERKSSTLHIVFFISFLLSAIIYFILLIYLTPNKIYNKLYSNWRQLFQLNNNNVLNNKNFNKEIEATEKNDLFKSFKITFEPNLNKQLTLINYTKQHNLRIILLILLFCLAVIITISFNLNTFYCIKHCKLFILFNK